MALPLSRVALACVYCLASVSCRGDDAGLDGGTAVDAGLVDAGLVDASGVDASLLDAGPVETARRLIHWNDGAGLSLVQPVGGSLDGYLRGGDFDAPVWASQDDMSWFLLHIVEGGIPTTDFARVSLPTVMGRDGNPATVLRVALLADAPDTDVEQIEFLEEQSVGVAGEPDPLDSGRVLVEPVFYQREWIKFDPNTADRAARIGAEFYQIFWEAKAVPDYRLRVQLAWDETRGLVVEAHDDGLRDANPIRIPNVPTSVPIVMADADSSDGWLLLEVFVDRTRGAESRWRVRFGGVDIVDYTGPLNGVSDHILNLPMFVQIYSDVADLDRDPFHELVDDLELWDRPPLDAWR